MGSKEEMREKAECIEDEGDKDMEDQMASERITLKSAFHSSLQNSDLNRLFL